MNAAALEAKIGASRTVIAAMAATVDRLQGQIRQEDQKVARWLRDLQQVRPDSPALVGIGDTVDSTPERVTLASQGGGVQGNIGYEEVIRFLEDQGFRRDYSWAIMSGDHVTQAVPGGVSMKVPAVFLEGWRREPLDTVLVLARYTQGGHKFTRLFPELNVAGKLARKLAPDYTVLKKPLSFGELACASDKRGHIDVVVAVELAFAPATTSGAWLEWLAEKVTNHSFGLANTHWDLVGLDDGDTLHVRVRGTVRFDVFDEPPGLRFIVEALEERDDETGEPLYWSNELGWADKESATEFDFTQQGLVDLPMGGKWAVKEGANQEGEE